MPKNQSPSLERSFPSQIVTFGLKPAIRFSIPQELAGRLEWGNDEKATSLVAELFEPGCVRVHRTDVANVAIASALQRYEEQSGHRSPSSLLRPLADKFREIGYTPSARRVAPSKEVAFFLLGDVADRQSVEVFMQAGIDYLEVMTLDRRNDRLSALNLVVYLETKGLPA